jgi:hypothetical protein
MNLIQIGTGPAADPEEFAQIRELGWEPSCVGSTDRPRGYQAESRRGIVLYALTPAGLVEKVNAAVGHPGAAA